LAYATLIYSFYYGARITAVNFVSVNLALNKPASQVSTYAGLMATGAVDGLFGSDRSCTHASDYAWWAVDLGEAYDVGAVRVTNDVASSVGNTDYIICCDE